jgi:hypothetical protein
MSPPGTEPLFPRFHIVDDYAVGVVKDCNWLQYHENIVDPLPPVDAAPVAQRRPVRGRGVQSQNCWAELAFNAVIAYNVSRQ